MSVKNYAIFRCASAKIAFHGAVDECYHHLSPTKVPLNEILQNVHDWTGRLSGSESMFFF